MFSLEFMAHKSSSVKEWPHKSDFGNRALGKAGGIEGEYSRLNSAKFSIKKPLESVFSIFNY